VAGEGKRFDLRVEDHLTPLAELRRLLQLARAYGYVEEADAAVGQGQYDNAAEAYQLAMGLAPDIAELKAWATITMVQMGQEWEAVPLFETAFRADPGLVELVPRVAALTRTRKTTLIRVCARSSRLLKRVQEPVA
jgi:tetratricopeptide (TPR) repeat protein